MRNAPNLLIMLQNKKGFFTLASLLISLVSFAQFNFSNEIGVLVGPVAFQSDYGERYDFNTNKGNVGFGVAIVHYMNFMYRKDCDCYNTLNYFNDHFKVRNELSYTTVKMEHFGKWVDPDKTSVTAEQLRGMRGETTILNLGTALEYYPRSIRDFENGGFKFAPYISLGANFGSYTPKAYSTLGPINETTYPEKYLNGGFTNEGGSVWSIMGNMGVRYKLGPLSDLVADAKWHYYFSNWVDGLNPNENLYPENRANDWQFWISVGYIYYLDL